MRIIIKNSVTHLETVLCHGPGRDLDRNCGPANLAGPIEFSVQPVERLRAASMMHYGRGNARAPVSFDVTRRCDSQEAAFLYLWTLKGECQTGDTLIVIVGNSTFTQSNCQLQRIRHTAPVDATLRIGFDLIAGRPVLA